MANSTSPTSLPTWESDESAAVDVIQGRIDGDDILAVCAATQETLRHLQYRLQKTGHPPVLDMFDALHRTLQEFVRGLSKGSTATQYPSPTKMLPVAMADMDPTSMGPGSAPSLLNGPGPIGAAPSTLLEDAESAMTAPTMASTLSLLQLASAPTSASSSAAVSPVKSPARLGARHRDAMSARFADRLAGAPTLPADNAAAAMWRIVEAPTCEMSSMESPAAPAWATSIEPAAAAEDGGTAADAQSVGEPPMEACERLSQPEVRSSAVLCLAAPLATVCCVPCVSCHHWMLSLCAVSCLDLHRPSWVEYNCAKVGGRIA
eukprot:jgi/Ulvmu1/12291/UM088_0007.1